MWIKLLLLCATPCFAGCIDTAEVRACAFFPTSNRFKDNFGCVGANYQLEIGKTFGCCCENQIWLGVDWYPKSGHLSSCGSSCIDILNASLGYKRFWCCGCFTPYLGIGPSFGYVWLENKRRCCSDCHPWKSKDQAFAVGGVARAGAQLNFCGPFFADLFVDYIVEVALFHRTAYIGGLKTGLGLGINF
ncbi:MAG: hypothetical protein P0S96_06630 [Simkaniaceae bacterium]|nr:hypothetical protein [Candidatus Sacchlamyda saccharinae]